PPGGLPAARLRLPPGGLPPARLPAACPVNRAPRRRGVMPPALTPMSSIGARRPGLNDRAAAQPQPRVLAPEPAGLAAVRPGPGEREGHERGIARAGGLRSAFVPCQDDVLK